jgi:hypothetical protein
MLRTCVYWSVHKLEYFVSWLDLPFEHLQQLLQKLSLVRASPTIPEKLTHEELNLGSC